MSKCAGGCGNEATTTYRDKARVIWRLCESCRELVKRRKA